MSELPGGNDPAGRRPDGPASPYGDDLVQFAGHHPQLAPFGRFGRRVNGRNEIRWSIGPDGRRIGEIVAHLEELHEPRPDAGPATGRRVRGPLGPDGRPRGSRFFTDGIGDLFPDEMPVDWVSWAAVEDALVAELRRGHHVTLTARAVSDPASPRPSVALGIHIADPRTGQARQYPFATLAEHAAVNHWGPARTPPLRPPSRPATRQPTQSPPQQPTQPFPQQPFPQQPDPRQAFPQPDPRRAAAGPTWWTGSPVAGPPQSPQSPQGPQVPPTHQVPDPLQVQARLRASRVAFSRGVLGTAFGVVAPTAIPLQDGGIRLNDDGDVIDRATLDRMSAQLTRRAEEQASGPRLLAEAVAMLGDTTARMSGDSPADGATQALDLLLDVPFLPQENRGEAVAVLRSVLDSRAEPAPSVERAPQMSAVVAAAQEISRDARVLDASHPSPGTVTVQGPGRHRRAVGGRHQRTDRTVGVPPISGTGLIASGRSRGEPELSIGEALDAAGRVRASDLGGRVKGDPVRQGGTVVVDTEQFGAQHFRVQLDSPGWRRVAAVDVRSGTTTDPHLVRMPPRLAGTQLGRVWVHAISHALQEKSAVRAGAGTGIVARIRSAVTGATRDRRTAAQYDEFRLLARNWQETRDNFARFGLAESEHRLRVLERDIQGLSAAMSRRGQSPPIPPWAAGPVSVNAVPASQVAAGARVSAVAHLGHRVATEIDRLDATARYLRNCATTKQNSAADAQRLAESKRKDARTESRLHDSGAAERARKLLVEADTAAAMQARHVSIAGTYTEAADRAAEAGDTYRRLLTELDATTADPNRPLSRVHALAAEAEGRVEASRERFAAALPSDFVLPSGVSVGRLPHLNALTRHINDGLEARSIPHTVRPELQHLTLRSDLGLVLGEGLVQPVGPVGGDASRQAQVKIRLKVPERYEVFEGVPAHSEMIVGQLDQRNHTVATTTTRSRGVKGRYGLRGLLSAIPGSGAVRAVADALSVVAPRAELAAKRATSLTTVSAANGRRGAVEDIRGEAVANRSDAPVWEVQFRNSPFEPWSEVTTVDTSGPDDSQSMTLRLSHAYTVPAPKAVTDIVKEGVAEQRSQVMPEHAATVVGGMNELADEAAVKFRKMFGKADAVAYGQLRSLFNEWPGRLDEAAAPGGFARTIVDKGVPIAWVQAETKVVWDSVELEGESSDGHWTERVRVSIATTGLAQTVATSTDKSLVAGYDFDGLGPTSATVGPSGTATRTRAGEEGMSISTTKYEVGVERVKRTQGYKARLVHTLTVHKLGSHETFEVSRTRDALLRMAETDAFRYGFPVAADAVVRDEAGKPKFHPDGRILLRGDPQPAGPEVVRPPWMGTGERQMRGKGPGQVPVVTGIDEARVLRGLAAEGLVPPLDDDLGPKLDELPDDFDRELLTSQLDNLERARQGISRMRAGTSYDQATQGGVTVPLELRRSGVAHAPERFVLDLSLRQRFETATVLGVSDAETPLFLDISSITSVESVNRSSTTKGALSLGLRAGDQVGGMDFPKISPGGHLQIGSSSGAATGVTSSRAMLREGTERGVAIAVPHSADVELRSRNGQKKLAGTDGYAVLLLEGEQCRPAPENPFWSFRGEAGPDVLEKLELLHLDAGDPRSQIWAALPPATRADPAAYHQLSAFCDVRSLVADPEWTRKTHRTRLVSPAPDTPELAARQFGLSPSDVTVELRARIVDLEHLGSGSPVSVRINLTLTSNSTTTGQSRGGGAGLSGGAGAPDDGASIGGSAEVGRGVVNSESSTAMEIGGGEGLGVNVGVHDDFRARVLLEAVVTQKGKQPQIVPLKGGAALYSIPERQLLTLYGDRAVDLPLERTADTVERLLNGKLALDRRTAAALVRRYRDDKVGVTQGLAASHTDERLAAALRTVSGMPEPAAVEPPERSLVHALDQTASVGRQRVEVALPEHYQTTMGEALVDEFALADWQTGRQVDVLGQVNALVERQSPGLLDRDAALADSLSGELEGDRWLGHRTDIWSPRGWVGEYSVKMSENGPPERTRVRIRGRFASPATTDGTPQPPSQDAINILQQYLYIHQSQSRTRAVNYTANLNLTGAGGLGVDGPTAGAGTHRLHSMSAANSQTRTLMSRIAHFDTAQVERGFYLVVDVERFPAPGTTKERLQRAVDRPAAVAAPVGTVLAGRMTQLVPRDYVGMSSPSAVPATQRLADHRTAVLPDNPYFVGSMRPHLSGEQETDHLFNALYERLGRPDLLTSAGVAAHQTTLENKTSMSRMQAGFKLLMSADGYRIDDLDVPGHQRRVGARITGKVYDLEQVAGPVEGVELGEVFRDEIVTQTTLGGNRVQPLTRTVGAGNDAADIAVSVTTGEQVSDKVTDLSGSRGERSMFTNPERVVVARLRYSCDVQYERRGLRAGSRPRVVDTQRNVAVGEAFVTMSEKDYQAMRAQMESGTAVAPPASAEKLDVRHMVADEYTIGPSGPAYHPYRPLVGALAQARQEGVVVALTVRQYDGSSRVYRATPDGAMTGVDDDGFAASFATLRPNLALLAEGRVDLRALYHSPRGQETFTRSVSAALERAGVPAAIVAEAAHSVGAQPPARHAVSGGPGHDEGARQHIGSTYTPGPTGHTGMSVSSPQIPGTRYVAGGRGAGEPVRVAGRAMAALSELCRDDFAGVTTGPVRRVAGTAVVPAAGLGDQHFRVETARPGADRPDSPMARTLVRTGTAADPHVVQVAEDVADSQLTRVWLHEITETCQVLTSGQPGCHAAWYNEHALLSRRWQAAEDEAARQLWAADLAGLERTMTASGLTPPPR